MSFPPRLPAPPPFVAAPVNRLRDLIEARLANPGIPDFNLPPALARVLARLPAQPPALALALALNLALDRILPRDSLEPLIGRWLRLIVTDAGLTLDFHLSEKGFRQGPPRPRARGAQVRQASQGQAPHAKPDLVLSARTRDFLALALREEDADTLFFSRRLRMEGNTALGLLVKNTLDAVDWSGIKERMDQWLPPRGPGSAGFSAG